MPSAELVSAASEAMSGVPEDLVVRSAQARASAGGVDVDDVLQAWAGGEAVATAPPTEEPIPEEPIPEEAISEEPGPEEAEPEEPAAAEPEAVPEPEPVAVPAAAVAAPEPEEPVEIQPAPLSERLRYPLVIGAVVGAFLGIAGALLATPLLLDRVAVLQTGEEAAAAVEVHRFWAIAVVAAASAVSGAFVALAARTVPTWFRREFSLLGSKASAIALGAAVGVALGAAGAAVLFALFGNEGSTEQHVLVPVASTVVLLLLGGALLGAVTTAVVQLALVPAGLPAETQTETEQVRRRLGTAASVPVLAAIAVLAVVLPFAWLLITFASAAPVIGTVVAASILAIAFLMTSGPGMRITMADVAVAAVGLGTIIFVIVLILQTVDGGGGHSAEEGEALVRSIVG